jgi:hypothetical protein
MSNSPLVNYTKISPNKTSPRNHVIDTITIHCVVGQLSVECLGDVFAPSSRRASSNYGVGPDGRIGMYVEEKDRSWCSSNAANDNRAITIEVASDTTDPYAITDAAYKGLIKLLVDICKRNNIKELKWKADKSLIGQVDKQNMTVHRWFANKSCPGDYLYDRHGQIAKEVNAKLGQTTTTTTTTSTSSVTYYVQTGLFKNKAYADAMYGNVKAAGFSPSLLMSGSVYKVVVGPYKKETTAQSTAKSLEKAGFATFVTTSGGTKVPVSAKKSIDEIAREVIQGKWGNGADRKNRLTKAGYDYKAVQDRVNELF